MNTQKAEPLPMSGLVVNKISVLLLLGLLAFSGCKKEPTYPMDVKTDVPGVEMRKLDDHTWEINLEASKPYCVTARVYKISSTTAENFNFTVIYEALLKTWDLMLETEQDAIKLGIDPGTVSQDGQNRPLSSLEALGVGQLEDWPRIIIFPISPVEKKNKFAAIVETKGGRKFLITLKAKPKFMGYDHLLCLKAILSTLLKQPSSEFRALPVYQSVKEGEKQNPIQKEVDEFEKAEVLLQQS